MSSDPKINPASNASDSTTVHAPPGFGPEALKELFARNQKVESENALLRKQLSDIRQLIEQERESRDRPGACFHGFALGTNFSIECSRTLYAKKRYWSLGNRFELCYCSTF